jgi:hypothetical protein
VESKTKTTNDGTTHRIGHAGKARRAVANYEARPKPRRDVPTIGPTERLAADLASSPSAKPTIVDKTKRRRTITQHGLHPTGAGATVSAGG